jgi:hypothetical protein
MSLPFPSNCDAEGAIDFASYRGFNVLGITGFVINGEGWLRFGKPNLAGAGTLIPANSVATVIAFGGMVHYHAAPPTLAMKIRYGLRRSVHRRIIITDEVAND